MLLVEDERQGGDHSSRQQHSGEDVQQPSAKRTPAPCLNPASTANKQGEQRSRTGEQVEGEYGDDQRDRDDGQVARLNACLSNCEHLTIIAPAGDEYRRIQSVRDRPIWAVCKVTAAPPVRLPA